MDWLMIANSDLRIYKDVVRIKNYVLRGKITEQQYEEITGEPYTA